MVAIAAMPLIITVILLVVGGFALVLAVNQTSRKSYYASRNKTIIDIVVVLLYLLFCGLTAVMYMYTGYNLASIYVMLGVLVVILIIGFLAICIKDKRHMSRLHLILFILYFAVVLYLTIFTRIGHVSTSIVTTPFDDLMLAIEKKDITLVTHMMLNIIMFVPFGYLIPAMNKHRLRGWYFAMLGGLMVSSVIEGLQMIFSLGQADIDDIIANTIGAVIGYGIVRFVWQVQKNWRF